MTKWQILEYFKDINLVYNDCTRYDTLKMMLDKLTERPTGEWKETGKRMFIDLEDAKRQYKELGYPHRNYISMVCSECHKTTMVDNSIEYKYCPHCGAKMKEGE